MASKHSEKIRARAVQQAVDAVKINRRKKKPYSMRFRSLKKDLTETLVVEKAFGASKGPINEFKASPRSNRCITAHFAPKTKLGKLGGVRLRDKAWLCEKIVGGKSLTEDALLKWEKSAKAFYLIIRIEEMSQRDNDLNWDNKRIVALDPGARTFQTFYSPDGTHGELLTNTKEYMDKKCAKIDRVQAHVAALREKEDLKHKQRWRKISRRHDLIRKLHYKLKCFRHNAHYAAANFLLRQWDVVMIPKFEVAKMTKNRPQRVMGKKSTREMYNWAHYEFRQRLISKSFKYAGRYIVVINEPGTSKTCGICGNWNAGLGGSKIFHCPSCHVELDRDVNGARNNLLAQIG
jgi:putative transposase